MNASVIIHCLVFMVRQIVMIPYPIATGLIHSILFCSLLTLWQAVTICVLKILVELRPTFLLDHNNLTLANWILISHVILTFLPIMAFYADSMIVPGDKNIPMLTNFLSGLRCEPHHNLGQLYVFGVIIILVVLICIEQMGKPWSARFQVAINVRKIRTFAVGSVLLLIFNIVSFFVDLKTLNLPSFVLLFPTVANLVLLYLILSSDYAKVINRVTPNNDPFGLKERQRKIAGMRKS